MRTLVNHGKWSWHSQDVMTLLQKQWKPLCLDMDVSAWRNVCCRSITCESDVPYDLMVRHVYTVTSLESSKASDLWGTSAHDRPLVSHSYVQNDNNQ